MSTSKEKINGRKTPDFFPLAKQILEELEGYGYNHDIQNYRVWREQQRKFFKKEAKRQYNEMIRDINPISYLESKEKHQNKLARNTGKIQRKTTRDITIRIEELFIEYRKAESPEDKKLTLAKIEALAWAINAEVKP